MKTGKTLLLMAFAAGLLTTSAQAYIYVDLTGPGAAVPIIATDPTAASVSFQLYIRITATADPTKDTLWKFMVDTRSTNVGGGLINGTLAASWVTTGSGGPNFSGDTTSKLGKSQDIDGDGDLDLGGIGTSTAVIPDYMAGRNASYITEPDANGFNMYNMTFTGTSFAGSNPHGVTELKGTFVQKVGYTMWKENGSATPATNLANQRTGQTITLYRPDNIQFDKPSIDLTDGPGTLDASPSVGSIDEWQWDINGDGVYEVKRATATSMTFSFDKLTGRVSWNDGAAGDFGDYAPTPAQVAAKQVQVNLRTKYGNDLIPLTHDEDHAMVILPEPATVVLLVMGGVIVAVRRRRVV